MKSLLTVAVLALLGGCAMPNRQEPRSPVKIESMDMQVAKRFLDALYRLHKTQFKVIADAASEESLSHISLSERNKELKARLLRLRQCPNPIRLMIASVDRPDFLGSDRYRFVYDRTDGILREVGRYDRFDYSSDSSPMQIRMRHWPDGTQLVCVSFTGLNDFKDNIFHLRKGESIFRYASAVLPPID